MAHERATRELNPQQIVPVEYSWQKLMDAEGTELEFEYTRMGLLHELVTVSVRPPGWRLGS
jgi:hypothetical protein